MSAAYPSLATSVCMVDRDMIELDKEYASSQFADTVNETYEDMRV